VTLVYLPLPTSSRSLLGDLGGGRAHFGPNLVYNKICPKSIGTTLIRRASTSTPPILGSLLSLLSFVN